MGENNTLISVIIPTYYRNDKLRTAIRSVENQTYPQIETIVVDDSGEQNAKSVVDDYPAVDYIALKTNQGPNIARTAGFQAASGEYIQFLDDDDELFEEKIEYQMKKIQESRVGVVYTGIQLASGEEILPDPQNRGDVLEAALKFELWPCCTSTMLIDNALVSEIMPLSKRDGGDDHYMMIEFAQLTEFDYVAAPLVRFDGGTDSRGNSFSAYRARLGLISQNEHLYSKYDGSVLRHAKSKTYRLMGDSLRETTNWSPRAIYYYLINLLITPDRSRMDILRVVLTLFGTPGWRLARFIKNRWLI